MTQHLLNDYQRDFPLNPQPFAQIAQHLNTKSDVVLETLKNLQTTGVVSRIGPVFKPNTVGASTLAAMAVTASELESVAAIINQFPQVNHNYEREHHFNLWFVVTAANQAELKNALQQIQQATGHVVLSLPMLKDYHIDLGFNMVLSTIQLPVTQLPLTPEQHGTNTGNDQIADPASGHAEDLIAVIQDGLPLVAQPYRQIGESLGWSEQAVINKLRDMLESGTIKRLGVVVRHHELGYRANAMVVWDVPGNCIDKLGQQMGELDFVTLCYQRPRALPDWPYNLFCMIHGCSRDAVLNHIRTIVQQLHLENTDHDILFSGRRFKQRGARYRLRH